ncbi:MAG TPA: hypothetical protein VNY10_06780 [Roseiarcus sp.]|jgi:hypothetical protein|nr:hypothetical protein [Roseiarcus sp.]
MKDRSTLRDDGERGRRATTRVHASERHARTDAWTTLLTFYEAPSEEEDRR